MSAIKEAKLIHAEFKEIESEYNEPDSLIDMGNWYYISKKQDEIITRLIDMLEWKPIESCPINRPVLFLIDGIPYKGAINMNGDVPCYFWWMHTNIADGEAYHKGVDDNGNEVRTMTRISAKEDYKPTCLGYKAGMNNKPTHWIPLPQQEIKNA